MYNRPYTVSTVTKRKEKEREAEEAKKNVGVFTTNESRKIVAQEIKKTHFKFGSGDDILPESLNKATYQNVDVQNSDVSNQQKKMSMQNKKSNFILGTDHGGRGETTSNQAYNSKLNQYMNGGPGSFSANTLRKGNFRLGFEKANTYETTAQCNFNNKNDQAQQSKMSNFRADKSSGIAKSLFGHTKPEYQTMNNSNFTQKDVSNSFKDKILMKERDRTLKQASFSFGHFNNQPYSQVSQAEKDKYVNKYQAEMSKQSEIAKQSKIKGTQVSSGSKFADKAKPDDGHDVFKSMAQVLFDEKPPIQGDASQIKNDMMKDLRSSHFQFGNAPGQIESCSHKDHGKFAIDQKGMEESKQLAKKMQSANFRLGDSKNAGPAQSAYKASISNNASNFTGYKEIASSDCRKTNIDIGKQGNVNYTSEAKDKFITNAQGQTGTAARPGNNLTYLKQNHFQLGAANSKPDYSTVNRSDFDSKPNYGYKKSDMNMQTTSFKMGYQGNPFSGTPQNPQSHTERGQTVPYRREVGGTVLPKSITAKGNSNQRENFSLGQNGSEFRTMNQAYYRWIQPKGDH